MILVNCAVEKNIPIRAVINSGADINCISQKYIGEFKLWPASFKKGKIYRT